jgi:hypothetical protein
MVVPLLVVPLLVVPRLVVPRLVVPLLVVPRLVVPLLVVPRLVVPRLVVLRLVVPLSAEGQVVRSHQGRSTAPPGTVPATSRARPCIHPHRPSQRPGRGAEPGRLDHGRHRSADVGDAVAYKPDDGTTARR